MTSRKENIMTIYHSVTELIGQTPLIQLHKLDTGPCSLFLKLENQNPGGSIKDRVALSMINEAERNGLLQPGGTIIEATAGNTRLNLVLALSYGSRAEIAAAVRKIAEKASRGELHPDAVTEDLFNQHLDTAGMPEPDLLIRTSGEMRVSNFLLWQISYAELYVTETLWPDFSNRDMEAALLDYSRRKRRFGAL